MAIEIFLEATLVAAVKVGKFTRETLRVKMSVNPVRQKLPQKFIYKTLPNQRDVKQTAEAHLLLSPGDNVDGTWDIAESRIG